MLIVTDQTAQPVANVAPTVSVGGDLAIAIGANLSLLATTSDDGLPGPALVYQWTQLSGPGIATFVSPTAEDSDVSFDTAGDYVLQLQADDSSLQTTDTLTVTVAEANFALAVNFGNIVGGLDVNGDGDYTVGLGYGFTGRTVTGEVPSCFVRTGSIDEDSICRVDAYHNGTMWIDTPTDTLRYQIDVPTAGTYDVEAMIGDSVTTSTNNARAYVDVSGNDGGSWTNIFDEANHAGFPRVEVPITVDTSNKLIFRFGKERPGGPSGPYTIRTHLNSITVGQTATAPPTLSSLSINFGNVTGGLDVNGDGDYTTLLGYGFTGRTQTGQVPQCFQRNSVTTEEDTVCRVDAYHTGAGGSWMDSPTDTLQYRVDTQAGTYDVEAMIGDSAVTGSTAKGYVDVSGDNGGTWTSIFNDTAHAGFPRNTVEVVVNTSARLLFRFGDEDPTPPATVTRTHLGSITIVQTA